MLDPDEKGERVMGRSDFVRRQIDRRANDISVDIERRAGHDRRSGVERRAITCCYGFGFIPSPR